MISLAPTWSVPPSVASASSASTSNPVPRDELRMRKVGRHDVTRWRARRRPLTGARAAGEEVGDRASSLPAPLIIPIPRERRGQTVESPAYPDQFMVSA